ncbi:MAG: hypothetical protein JOS17DRAFT_756869 [Linnemannia elongata]|nr:MAG: hypothetical protein JOS17DRAFT_756869 [Linnemannia elongata]
MPQLILLSKIPCFVASTTYACFFSHETEHSVTVALFFRFITFSPFVFFTLIFHDDIFCLPN